MKDPKDTRILVVDDEVYMREIVAFDLEKQGYQVVHADCGKAAIDLVKSGPFDLVISDVRMPSGTGVELLKWIKDFNPTTPSFIFMTAFSDISADEAMDQGAEAFLPKPLVREGFMEQVQKALISRAERWAGNTGEFEGAQKVAVAQNQWEGVVKLPQIALGSGGLFLEMSSGFPECLEIIAFELPVNGVHFEGYGRVRWVRHEDSEGRPPGIGLEFLHLSDESRRHYLDFLSKHTPRAYVPLGTPPDAAFRAV